MHRPEAQVITYEARMAGHLAVGFMLDVADLGRHAVGLLDALLWAAIVDANVSPVLHNPALQAAYARLDTPPPDSVRRPVSINALAESLHLPFETVRRHVRRLVAARACSSGPQGVMAPTGVVTSPIIAHAQLARYTRVVQFYQELRAADAVEPLPFSPLASDDPQAPVRAVGRILSDYFFRTLSLHLGVMGDTLNGLIMLEVLRTGAEHIAPAQVEDFLRSGWIPASARAPVPVAQVARRLRTPYETTRRHVSWLVEDGMCRRDDRGLLPATDRLEQPDFTALCIENHANIRRMFRYFAALAPTPED